MRKIPPEISGYIDVAIEKQRIIFKSEVREDHLQLKAEMEHHNGALMNVFDHRIKAIAEMVQEKPGREEVREMIRQEIRPISNKLDVVIDELSGLRKDFDDHILTLH